MTRRTAAIIVCLAICCSTTASQSVEISGAWKIATQGGPTPTCSFVQVENNLSGSCVGPQATGTVSGEVNGPTVRWRWRWVTYAHRAAGAFDFLGTLSPDNTITGKVERRETGLSLAFTAREPILALDQPGGVLEQPGTTAAGYVANWREPSLCAAGPGHAVLRAQLQKS